MYKRGRSQVSVSSSRTRSRSKTPSRSSSRMHVSSEVGSSGNVTQGTTQVYNKRYKRLPYKTISKIVQNTLPEPKVFPVESATITTLTTGLNAGATPCVPVLLNGIVQGTTRITRIGQRIRIFGIVVRCYNFSNSAAATYGPLKLIILYDREANGSTAAINNGLYAGATANSIIDPMLPYNRTTRDFNEHFQIVKEWVIKPQGNQGSGETSVISEYIKCDLDVYYNTGNTGTVADIDKGALYVVLVGWNGQGNANTCQSWIQIKYNDA